MNWHLRPGEARMMSVRKCLDRPQAISANRHIMQAYIDIVSTNWNSETNALSGVSKIVGKDPYILKLAANGYKEFDCSCNQAETKLELSTENNGLTSLVLQRSENAEVNWVVTFNKKNIK